MMLTLAIAGLLFNSFQATAIWPKLFHISTGSDEVWLSHDVEITYQRSFGWQTIAEKVPFAAQLPLLFVFSGQILFTNDWVKLNRNISSEEFLTFAIERFKTGVFDQNFVPRKFYPSGWRFKPATDRKIVIEKIAINKVSKIKQLDSIVNATFLDEAYRIHISASGECNVQVHSDKGALHALGTLSQLFYADPESPGLVYTNVAPLEILDYPVFQHRGLNLDISRNQIYPEDVMRVIDGMSFNKLNKLHLHATDAQSWPLEVKAYPELAIQGAYEEAQIWTVSKVDVVQYYGMLRGVDVFLEIDMPGHTTSISKAFPSLITAAGMEDWQKYALEPPSGQLKLNSTEVHKFLETMLNDLLPRSRTYSSLFHIGGDELNRNAYGRDPTVNSTSKAVLRPLVQSFVDKVLKIAVKHGLTPVIWEEMLLDWNLTLPRNTLIQTWRSTEALSKVLSSGHRAIFGSNSHWYLDCGFGTFLDPTEPSEPREDPTLKPPFLDYCTPYKNWRHVYSYDPLKDIPLSQHYLIVGGEVHLWGELTDSVTLDGMLWPRAAAAAEVLWSGGGDLPTEDTTRRLAEMRERLLRRKIAAGMVQMEWCLRNKGGCTI
ncbi:MAG: N-acetyl-glucosamine-6-phosphate deacetylase [Bogoriella megaspora]|nr:MAG: N-acetyl-glucosamine-6-phosphate deacetylase [Bogoriella megaspora]